MAILGRNADEAAEPDARRTINAGKADGEADAWRCADDRSFEGEGAAGQRDTNLLKVRAFRRRRSATVDIAAGRTDAADTGSFFAAVTQPIALEIPFDALSLRRPHARSTVRTRRSVTPTLEPLPSHRPFATFTLKLRT